MSTCIILSYASKLYIMLPKNVQEIFSKKNIIFSEFKCVNTKLYFQIFVSKLEIIILYKFFERAWYYSTAKKNVILRML